MVSSTINRPEQTPQTTGTRKFRPTPRAVSSQSRLIQVSGDLKSGEITRRDHSNYFETNLVPNLLAEQGMLWRGTVQLTRCGRPRALKMMEVPLAHGPLRHPGHTVRALASKSTPAKTSPPQATPPSSSVSNKPGLPPFVDEVLRGVGQVVFCNSAASGALMLAALFKGDPWLGTLATIGTVSATTTAKVFNLDSGAIANGLTGYNGCLVGCAFSVFMGTDAWTLPTAVAAAVAAGGSTLLTVPLKMACGAVPQFTLAFNMATLSVLAFVRPLWEFSPPPDPSAVVGGITDWLCAPLVGVSQIFVVNDPIAGAMMLGAIGVYSPQCAALTLMGSAIGTGTGAVLGASHFDIANGLWGFNAALTSLAVGVFFVPKLEMYALAGSGAVASTLVFGGAKGIVAAGLGIPVCTLPFCAVASACMLTPRLGLVPGLLHAANPHSPEKNEAP